MKVVRVHKETLKAELFNSITDACPAGIPYWKFTRRLKQGSISYGNYIYQRVKTEKV